MARDMMRGRQFTVLRLKIPFFQFFILKMRLPSSVNLICLISSLDSNELD